MEAKGLMQDGTSAVEGGRSRRNFLRMSSSALLAVAAWPAEVAASAVTQPFGRRPMRTRLVSLDDLHLATFAGLVQTRFWIVHPRAEELALTEARVTSLRRAGAEPAEDDDFEKFSLLFEGSDQEPLEQGIHRLWHPAVGLFDLFIVPVGPEFRGRFYEAIFNRPLPTTTRLQQQ